jgi:hypothetical protein
MKNEELYNKILLTKLLSHGDLYFIDKLVTKHKWGYGKAHDLYCEYKKFLYLSTFGPVIPPPLIDLVWHEHILFTKEYDEMSEVLGKKLHHYPDVPGAYVTDQSDWKRTLDRYIDEFGDSKLFQKYWLGLNAWKRYWRRMRIKKKLRSGGSISSDTYTSSSGCSSLFVVPMFGCSSSHCSSGSSHCSSSSCGSSCGSGCGGGCGGS